MDMTVVRHANALLWHRIEARATAISTKSDLVATIMRAAAALADGEPAEAGRKIIDAICAIDGQPIDAEVLDQAQAAVAPLVEAVAGVHTCQACAIRSLVDLIGRLGQGVRPERIGEILGGLHTHAANMVRTQSKSAKAA